MAHHKTATTPCIMATTSETVPAWSFLTSIPLEIRNHIYFILLRPDLPETYDVPTAGWINALGCTKVLTLCRQTYSEAIQMLEPISRIICVAGDRPMFRSMHAQGKPGFFMMASDGSACYVPSMLTELEYRRLTRLTININCPDPEDDHKMTEFETNMKKLIRLINHSDVLRCMDFIIDSNWPGLLIFDEVENGTEHRETVPYINETFLRMLQIAADKKIRLMTEVLQVNSWEPATVSESAEPKVQTAAEKVVECIQEMNNAKDEQGQELYPSRIITTGEIRHVHYNFPPRDFSLIPECRQCFELFGSFAELRSHLQDFPKHSTAFRRGKYNVLSWKVSHQIKNHKCMTCGVGWDSKTYLQQHQKKTGHFRHPKTQGMIPRWTKDNDWHTCVTPLPLGFWM